MYGTLGVTATSGEHSVPLLDDTSSKSSLSIPRERLVYVLSKRAERSAACSRVPLALLVYILTCYIIILHGHASTAYELESTLSQQVVGSFRDEVVSANAWLDFFAGTGTADGVPDPNSGWINAVVGNRDNGKAIPAGLGLRGRIRDTIKIIGGVHITQTRRSVTPCPVAGIRSLYGSCHGGVSTAPYGDPSAFVAGAINVTSAFFPSRAIGSRAAASPLARAPPVSSVFQLWLDVEKTRATNQGTVTQLDQAGWLDGSTASVRVEVAVVNGETGFLGRVALNAEFNVGGRVAADDVITSLPIDPYGMYPQLAVLDTFVVIYLVYLLCAMVFNAAHAAAEGRYSALLSYWSLLEYACAFTLLAAVVRYAAVVNSLGSIGLSPTAGPTDYSGGCSACPATLDCCSAGANILTASDQFEAFKSTVVVYLIFASLYLFRCFEVQPRLAVFARAFARAAPDLLHFSLVFGVIMAMFGVWGHFQFGSIAPDWHTVQSSITAVFRIMQYDYDLVVMQQVREGVRSSTHGHARIACTCTHWQPSLSLTHTLTHTRTPTSRPCPPPPQKNPGFADAFFVLALYGVTNLLLWMLVGIILESFSDTLQERAAAPSVVDELWLLWLHTRAALASFRPSTALRWLTVRANVLTPRAFGATGSGSDTALPSYAVLTAALTTGSLAGQAVVTPELLAAALGVSLTAASYLIAQVQATSAVDAECGWALPLPEDMERALAELQEGGSRGGGAPAAAAAAAAAAPLQRSKTSVFQRLARRAEEVREGAEGSSGEGSGSGSAAGADLQLVLAQLQALSGKVDALAQRQ